MKIRTAATVIATLAALGAPAVPSASAATAKSDLFGDLSISTCNVGGAGTDDEVSVRLHSYNGLTTDWQVLGGDFERGSREVFDLPALPDGWDLTSAVELRKEGADDWCVRSVRLGSGVGGWGPRPLRARAFPYRGARYTWIGDNLAPGAHLQPNGTVYIYSYPTLTVTWPYLR
ncbi:PLAT/LH2 domain-containing protein [Streptomyces sp. NPDC002577]